VRVYYPEYHHNLSIYYDALAKFHCGEGEKRFGVIFAIIFHKNPLEIANCYFTSSLPSLKITFRNLIKYLAPVNWKIGNKIGEKREKLFTQEIIL
jgi:hypothetical protein